MPMKKIIYAVLGLFTALYASAQNYTVLGNASALSGCNCFQVTPDANNQAGAIFQNNTINLNNSFDYTFNVFLGCNGSGGADGMMFVLTSNPNGLGNPGEGLGYAGNNQPFSLAVEFDTWQNGSVSDPSFDHIGIHSGGLYNHNVAGAVSALPSQANIDDCQWHTVRIVWNVNTNTYQVYFDGNLRVSIVIPNMVGTYFGGNPIVNWGWSGATGGGTNLQQVCVQSTSSWVAGVNYQTCSTSVQFNDISTSNLGSVQSWLWNFGDGNTSNQQNPLHTYAGTGTYTVSLTITDLTGCTTTFTNPVTINPPISLTPTLTQPPCNGGSNGSVSVAATGGFGPAAGYGGYTYTWNGGASIQQTYSGVPAGTYTVTVTDGVCTTTGQYTLNQPSALSATTSSTAASCAANNGSVTINITGGTPPYQNITWAGIPGATVTGLAAGNYIANFQDANGCSALLQYSQTVASLPCGVNASTSSTNVSCFGGSNGTATLTVTGGSPPSNISWSNGGSGATITGLVAGTYTYTYTDQNPANTFTGSITITQPGAAMVASLTTVNTSCSGTNDGQAIASVTSGGNPGYNYAWSGGQPNNAVAGNLAAGPITVTITDATGCTATANGTISGPPALTLNITSVNDSCFQGETGRATANVSGGNPPYTYFWSNISSAQTNLGLTAGVYTVTVTDDKGCTITGSASISEPAPLVTNTVKTDVLCFGETTGTITVSATGGTPAYTYTWNPGSVSGNAPTNLAAGVYLVTTADNLNCQAIDTILILEPPTALNVTTSHTDVSCHGGSDGTATINISGGIPPYSFLGNPLPPGTTTIPGLPADTYAGPVTDANGCTVNVSETISEPGPQSVSLSTTDVLCGGASTGSITANFINATGTVTYTWSNAQSGATINNLPAASYTVTATDQNGCTQTASATLIEPTPLQTNVQQTDVLCAGDATGSITITASGGTPAYTYTWNPGSVTGNAPINLTAGPYTVTTSDANGCTVVNSITINSPANALSVTTSHTDVSCHGGSDGTATINISGGTAPYTYLGNPIPAGSTTIPGLPAGTYAGPVADANGCTVNVSETIDEPGPQSVTVTTVDNICFGGQSGSITATFVNATGTVTYNWSNAQTGSTVNNLPAATYSVTATDQNGCTQTASATINEPAAPVMNVNVTDALCFGSNGSATALPTVGTPPYTFTWSGTTQTTATVSLVNGSYTVTATDANQCGQTASFVINSAPQIIIQETHTDVNCFGENTGSILLTVSGGTGVNYTYSWNPNISNSAVGSLLTAGIYQITVTDEASCTETVSITINQPAQALNVNVQSNNISCFGQNNGSITVTTTGGTAPYNFTWSPAVSTTNTASSLSPGNYSITIQDANGCQVAPSVVISEPNQPLTLTGSQVDLTCFQSNDGSASITVTGGTFPYAYSWSNNVNGINTISNIAAGSYSVTVTDNNGCTGAETFTINQPSALVATEVHTNNLCFGDATATASINASGGTAPYTYAWSPAVSTTMDAQNLAAGIYSVTVSDTNTCSATVQVNVLQPDAIQLTVTVGDVFCNGGSTGTISVTASGGTPVYQYQLTQDSITFVNSASGVFNGLQQGSYIVITTDANNCVAVTNTTVNEPAPISVTPTLVQPQCFGYTNGSISLTSTGGAQPFTYQFSNGVTNTNGQITGLGDGTYDVTVTDVNGCSIIQGFTLTEPDSVEVLVSPNPTEIELGESLPISVTTNQSGSLSYTWQPAFGLSCNDCSNPTFEGVYSQAYTVVVTNQDGCNGSASFTATVIPKYDIFIPNAFTPNADGANDFWQVFTNVKAIKQFEVQVFNRWGEKVFESNDINYRWDGTYKGALLPPAVYVYQVKVVWLDNYTDALYKGSVTLLK